MRCTWGNSSLPITSEISVSSDSNRLKHASCSLLHYCNNYCILLITIALYCTILIALLQYVLTGSGHLWTFADWQTLCPSTGHLHSPACPAACPLSTGLGQSCSTPQHHASQPRAAWPWDAMDTVDTWTPKRCKKLQKDVQCIAHCFWALHLGEPTGKQ